MVTNYYHYHTLEKLEDDKMEKVSDWNIECKKFMTSYHKIKYNQVCDTVKSRFLSRQAVACLSVP